MRVNVEVIRGLQNKQEESFEFIYKKYKKGAYVRIRNIIGDDFLAEQILNDTFLKVYQKAYTFVIKTDNDKEIEAKFCKWVMTIARNLAINEYKKIMKEKLVYIENIDKIADTHFSYRRTVNDYLPILDEDELQIVVDHLFCKLTFRAIAEDLNSTESIVNKKYHKALKKAKDHLKRK